MILLDLNLQKGVSWKSWFILFGDLSFSTESVNLPKVFCYLVLLYVPPTSFPTSFPFSILPSPFPFSLPPPPSPFLSFLHSRSFITRISTTSSTWTHPRTPFPSFSFLLRFNVLFLSPLRELVKR